MNKTPPGDGPILLRGPRGPRGDSGLSAYGVWLREGNMGTCRDFLDSLKAAHPYLYLCSSGKCIGRGIRACDKISAQITQPGIYKTEFYCSSDEGCVFCNDSLLEGCSRKNGLGFAVFSVEEPPYIIRVSNVSDSEYWAMLISCLSPLSYK